MKVLILSAEVWQDGTNGGNVLSNMFAGSGFTFAQIYCTPGKPKNSLCTRYYQMTDRMVIRALLGRRPIGKAFETGGGASTDDAAFGEMPNARLYAFFHRHPWSLFYALRSAAWELSNWRNDRLRAFVRDFDPDVIFAPCYGDVFMLRLTRYVAELTGKRIISYISDDAYTLRQISFSPLYWVRRFRVRRQLRRTFPLYSLVYTMTRAQKEQCERDLHGNMKLLMKSVDLSALQPRTRVNDPIRIVYAGGIYLGRYKTLSALAKAIEGINASHGRDCFHLDIYTATERTARMNRVLDHRGTEVHDPVSQEELQKIYRDSDIALHVESLGLRERLKVRMSFSTKITDCLGSGCAVMAICDEKQGGYRYLRENDAAVCVSRSKDLPAVLEDLLNAPRKLLIYGEKARACCRRNHDAAVIHKMIEEDFRQYADRSNQRGI